MRKRAVLYVYILAVAALLFIVSCPEETTAPRDEDEEELTIESITSIMEMGSLSHPAKASDSEG